MHGGRNLCGLLIFLLAMSAAQINFLSQSSADERLSIWFMPAGNSPDIDELFERGKDWPLARSLIDAFVFSPGQLSLPQTPEKSLYLDLVQVNAFRQIRNWGKKIAIEVPALKEWDCDARQTASITENLIESVSVQGGHVQYLAMDEPLISALGLNVRQCHLTVDNAAEEVAQYARAVESSSRLTRIGVIPEIVDIEAYPSLSVQQIVDWIVALQRHGFKPAGFNLDPNLNFIDANPTAKARLAGDLKELQSFFRQQGIPFGIIIWSGYDPVQSDKEYYDRAMSWVRTIHDDIGAPDRLVFSSWVKRCTEFGRCTGQNLGCTSRDPAYCGTISVPLNLPESGVGVYSHTRLIIDATALLNGR